MVACLFYVVYNIHNKNVYSIEKTGGYTVREIRLKARAKINLTLDVTGKREDGYHLLETIMQTVALYDGIYMKKLEKFIEKFKKNPDFIYDKEYDKVSVEENQPAMAADGCAQSGVEGGKPDAGDLRHKGGCVY